jgi:serine/threonine protein kinase
MAEWEGVPGSGDKLHLRSGGTIRLDDEIGRGGEGKVLRVDGRPDSVVKLFQKPSTRDEFAAANARIQKLIHMIDSPPVNPTAGLGHPSLAWPEDIVFQQHGQSRWCWGYLMPAAGGHTLDAVSHPKVAAKKKIVASRRDLYGIAANLCSAVAAIHDAGYAIGDFHGENVLVNQRGLVTLIDADSFTVGQWRSAVGKEAFQAPEVLRTLRQTGLRYEDIARGPLQDRWALAVLLYRLLMLNAHPFDAQKLTGSGNETVELSIAGEYPHSHRSRAVPSDHKAKPREVLDPRLADLFEATFDGARGAGNPSVRPSPLEMRRALEQARASLVSCPDCSEDVPSSLPECGVCRLLHRRGTPTVRSKTSVSRPPPKPSHTSPAPPRGQGMMGAGSGQNSLSMQGITATPLPRPTSGSGTGVTNSGAGWQTKKPQRAKKGRRRFLLGATAIVAISWWLAGALPAADGDAADRGTLHATELVVLPAAVARPPVRPPPAPQPAEATAPRERRAGSPPLLGVPVDTPESGWVARPLGSDPFQDRLLHWDVERHGSQLQWLWGQSGRVLRIRNGAMPSRLQRSFSVGAGESVRLRGELRADRPGDASVRLQFLSRSGQVLDQRVAGATGGVDLNATAPTGSSAARVVFLVEPQAVADLGFSLDVTGAGARR